MSANLTPAATLHRSLPMLCIALALCACGEPDSAREQPGKGGGVNTLPQPEAGSGSITGMPDTPGPGQVGTPSTELPPDTPVASDGSIGLPPDDGVDAYGMSPSSPGMEPTMAGEPTPQDAVAVVRDYYAAINSGSYGRAYALWSDGGNANGQTPQQFADGFADTSGVSVQIESPGRVDAAAGSRYIEIPVAVESRQRDGSVRRFVGAYTLRRAVADGASAEQRQWRITSADMREERP